MAPEAVLRRLDGWIFAPEDARRLAALRIGLCGVLALRLALVDDGSVTGPLEPFRPHFYMELFSRMPSYDAAEALRAVGIAAAVAAAAGLAFRATLPLALACSLVLNGMLNSAGRVIVGDALLTLCLLVLVAAGPAAAEAWTLRGGARGLRGPRYGWPVRTAAVAVALAYFFAGVQKWRYSGLSWITSDNLRLILYASSDAQPHPNGLALAVAAHPLLAHLLAAGALGLETCFPLVLLVPSARWLFLAGALAMHLGIRLAMGLDYSAQWLTAAIVLVDWPALVARLRR